MSGLPQSESAPIGRRASARARLYLPARIESLEGFQRADIINLSCSGAQIEVDRVPKAGASVILRYGPVESFCDVVWTDGARCGLRFEEPLSDDEVLAARRESDELPRLEAERRCQLAQSWVLGSSQARGDGL